MATNNNPSAAMPDNFDRTLGMLDGLPDLVRTRQAVVRITPPFGVGGSETFIIQTLRQKGGDDAPSRDTVFLEYVTGNRAVRIVMPAEVANVIARQRDQLTSQMRRKGARAAVATRKEKGIVSTFKKKVQA